MNEIRNATQALSKFMLAAMALLSLYLTGAIGVFMTTLNITATLNPIMHVRYAATVGFNFSMFFIILLVTELIGTCVVSKYKREHGGMDKMGRLFTQSTDKQSYGSSHFEEPEEYSAIASVQSPKDAYGTILGQLTDDGTRVINTRMDNTRNNRNICVIGASGSGKTFSFSKPFCYQAIKRRESIVITDPDGGLYRDTARLFQDKGYIVRRFDLTNLMKSDGWDCMKTIKKESAALDAQVFAHTIIANTVDDLTSIYAVGPEALLKALILRVYLDTTLSDEEKNIGKVYSFLQDSRGEDFLNEQFDHTRLMSIGALEAEGPWLSFKQASPNLRGNLITNLAVQLQLFQSDVVKKVLSTNDIDLTLPGDRPCAYFCLFPDSHNTYAFIVSLFFSMFFTNLIAYADQKCGGALKVPVNFLLDEFPSIGRLPDWDKKMATIRKRNINATMIFQNITQIQNIYKDSWSTIISNCDTMVILGINDIDSANLVSKRIGDTSIKVESESHPANEAIMAFKFSHSEGEGKRALLSVDELHKLNMDESLIIFRAHNPIWARKYPHTLHPYVHEYLDENEEGIPKILPDSIPDITDEEARAEKKEEEKERIAEWYRDNPEEAAKEKNRKYTGLCEPEVPLTKLEQMKKAVRTVKGKIDEVKGVAPSKSDKKVAPKGSTKQNAGKSKDEDSDAFELVEDEFVYDFYDEPSDDNLDNSDSKSDENPASEQSQNPVITVSNSISNSADKEPEEEKSKAEIAPEPQQTVSEIREDSKQKKQEQAVTGNNETEEDEANGIDVLVASGMKNSNRQRNSDRSKEKSQSSSNKSIDKKTEKSEQTENKPVGDSVKQNNTSSSRKETAGSTGRNPYSALYNSMSFSPNTFVPERKSGTVENTEGSNIPPSKKK